MAKRTIVAVPSDLHSGSSVGLCTREDWKLENGQNLAWSESQKVCWNRWMTNWHTIRGLKDKNTQLIVVHNGDAVDGDHHDTTELVTSNYAEQERMHISAMEYALEYVGGANQIYYVRGTDTHVKCSEETIARYFDAEYVQKPSAINKQDGKFLHDILRLDVNGVEFFFAHQIFGTGKMAHTKDNPLRNKLKSYYIDCRVNNIKPPDIMVSSHFHQALKSSYYDRRGEIHGYVNGAMQTKTHYGKRVAPLELADIGFWYFVVEKNGSVIHPKFKDCFEALPDTEVRVV